MIVWITHLYVPGKELSWVLKKGDLTDLNIAHVDIGLILLCILNTDIKSASILSICHNFYCHYVSLSEMSFLRHV